MKNMIVYLDKTNTPVAKAMAHSHAAYEAMRRAGKQGIKALYCAPEEVERVKGDLLALAAKGAQATAPAAPKIVAQKDYTVRIWADGSCLGNPGPGGWAAILEMDMQDGSVYRKELSGHGTVSSTNNSMEIAAVANALSAIRKPCHVTIYTDSAYVANAFTKGWIHKWAQNGWVKSDKKPVENIGLWKNLLAHVNIMKSVEFVHIAGHAGDTNNERCDKLAKAAAKEVQIG